MSLDETNTDAGRSPTDDRQPKRRTTGIALELKILYGNTVRGSSTPVRPGITKVNADIEVNALSKGWAGWGGETFVITPNSGEAGKESYHKVIIWKQGIVLRFQIAGTIYWLDHYVIINLLIATIVLLGVSRTITDLIAFNLPGSWTNGLSTVFTARRYEHVNKKGVFAELGLKSTMHAMDFLKLDADQKGNIRFEDLVRPYGMIEQIDYDKATRIAQRVLDDVGTKDNDGKRFISFVDFMQVVEGQMMDFDDYLKFVGRGMKNRENFQAMNEARKIYSRMEGMLRNVGGASHAHIPSAQAKRSEVIPTAVASRSVA